MKSKLLKKYLKAQKAIEELRFEAMKAERTMTERARIDKDLDAARFMLAVVWEKWKC